MSEGRGRGGRTRKGVFMREKKNAPIFYFIIAICWVRDGRYTGGFSDWLLAY